jgi:uncharacterized protein (DUF433 family)
MENLIARITINPDVCHGKPTIRNMRYSVEMILDLLSSGMTFDEIIDDYPVLQNEDLKACLSYASKLISIKILSKVA